MEVVTMESDSFKELVEKIDSIASYIKDEKKGNNTESDEIWVDSYEVCTFLRISERTLQRLRSNKLVSYSIIGGKTYYTIKEVRRLLEEHLIKSEKDCLDDLINHHHSYLELRRKNKAKK